MDIVKQIISGLIVAYFLGSVVIIYNFFGLLCRNMESMFKLIKDDLLLGGACLLVAFSILAMLVLPIIFAIVTWGISRKGIKIKGRIRQLIRRYKSKASLIVGNANTLASQIENVTKLQAIEIKVTAEKYNIDRKAEAELLLAQQQSKLEQSKEEAYQARRTREKSDFIWDKIFNDKNEFEFEEVAYEIGVSKKEYLHYGQYAILPVKGDKITNQKVVNYYYQMMYKYREEYDKEHP